MEIKIDTKSLVLGALVAGFMFMSISGKNPTDQSTTNRYQTRINDSNFVLILDTQTGNYLFTTGASTNSKNQWIKGEFNKTFATAKDNRRE